MGNVEKGFVATLSLVMMTVGAAFIADGFVPETLEDIQFSPLMSIGLGALLAAGGMATTAYATTR